MKLDRRKTAGTLILGCFVAAPFLWHELQIHSAVVDVLIVLGFATTFLIAQLGINQSLYRSNRSLQKME